MNLLALLTINIVTNSILGSGASLSQDDQDKKCKHLTDAQCGSENMCTRQEPVCKRNKSKNCTRLYKDSKICPSQICELKKEGGKERCRRKRNGDDTRVKCEDIFSTGSCPTNDQMCKLVECKKTYKEGQLDSLLCPNGYEKIDKEKCKEYAISIGVEFKEEDKSYYPQNCYHYHDIVITSVYFNIHHTGSEHHLSKVVCIAGTAL
jgi:hypothetical protein